MAKHSVNVLIRAKDEASRKFLTIGGAAKVMGTALKGAAAVAKKTLSVAFNVVKRAAIGLAAAFAYCTYAAIKQEASEIELASALKMTGEYSEEVVRSMKAQAAGIQDATVYGDEYILMLMRMALTQGVTADKAADAAKAAIALHAGFGGGRGKPEIFLRYYIDALRGTGSSLESYVGELRKAETQEEKMVILQKALAAGWDVAKSKADSAGGALKQMKNKLGDVAEVIAKPFLPDIQRSGEAIKKWAAENEANIGHWANKAHSYVTLIKDVFLDFMNFMKDDWRAAISFAFDSFLELMKAAFKTAVTMSIAAGKGIWKGVKEGLLGTTAKKVEAETRRRYEAAGGPIKETLVAGGGAFATIKQLTDTEKLSEIRSQVEKEFAAKQIESIIGNSFEVVKGHFKDAAKTIAENTPKELGKAITESLLQRKKRLEELLAPPEEQPAGAGGVAGAPGTFPVGSIGEALKEAVSRAVPRLAFKSAGRMMYAPSRMFNKVELNTARTANYLEKLVRLNIEIRDYTIRMGELRGELRLGNSIEVSDFR